MTNWINKIETSLADIPRKDFPDNKIAAYLSDTLKFTGQSIAPFRQFSANYINEMLNYLIPSLSLGKSLFHASQGNRAQSLENLGKAFIGASMYGSANWLYNQGLIEAPMSQDKKIRSVQFSGMGPGRINISGLERVLTGGDPTFQPGDSTIQYNVLGMPGLVFGAESSRLDKIKQKISKGEEVAESLTSLPEPVNAMVESLGSPFSRLPGAASTVLDQTYMASINSFLEGVKAFGEDPDSPMVDRWFQNYFNTITAVAIPNTVATMAKAEYGVIPDLRGETLTDTLTNVWKFKTFSLDEGFVKRGLFGEPIERTPKGSNKIVYNLLDPSKLKTQPEDNFKFDLINLYQQTSNPDVYPNYPSRNFSLSGKTLKLNTEEYSQLQEFVGRTRKQLINPVIQDSSFKDLSSDEKVMVLKSLYGRGLQVGKALMLSENSEFNTKFTNLFAIE